MNNQDKIYIAGHRGMVGSAIKRKLESEGFRNLVYKSSDELDLRNQQDVHDFFEKEKPGLCFSRCCESRRYHGQRYISRGFSV